MSARQQKTLKHDAWEFFDCETCFLAALKIAEDYRQLKRDYDELLHLLDENK